MIFKTNLKLSCVLVAALIAANAAAADVSQDAPRWIPIASSSNGTLDLFVDRYRIRWQGPIVNAWVRSVDQYGYSIQQYEGNCTAMSIRSLQSTTYSNDGILMRSDALVSPWRPVVPESIAETGLVALCANRPQ